MAKATTNGIVPMGVVAVREKIYNEIMEATPDGGIELFHGYTYSGIPVAVSAALAVQEIFEKEDIFNKVKKYVKLFSRGASFFKRSRLYREYKKLRIVRRYRYSNER